MHTLYLCSHLSSVDRLTMPGAKQIFAWEESKKRKGPEGLERSQLAKQFLHLWSLGKLSSSGVQIAADAATGHGNFKPVIVELAKFGNFGAHPANCHRVLLRLLQQKLQKSTHGGLKESPIITVPVPCVDPKEDNPNTTAECHIVLPHLFVSEIFNSYPELAPSFFGLEKLDFSPNSGYTEGVLTVRVKAGFDQGTLSGPVVSSA